MSKPGWANYPRTGKGKYDDYYAEMSSGSGYAVDTKRRAIRNLEKYATDNELI